MVKNGADWAENNYATSRQSMCFMLYAGTSRMLPRKEWRTDAPDISVRSLTEIDVAVKEHFEHSQVQLIGSTSHCGCDFPCVNLQNGEWPTAPNEDAERIATESYNRQGLFRLLQDSDEETLELYCVWSGDIAKAPSVREEINLNRILDEDFYFKERGFYLARANRAPSRATARLRR